MAESPSIRLNKFISETGLCSRREADKYIASGNVLINGKRAIIGDQVKVGDKVMVNGNALTPRKGEDIIFIALNKPVGITSTSETHVKDNIVDYVRHSQRIFPIGRLDKDSQGLIFLTNNGDLVNKILRSGNQHEKEYLVTVDKPLSDEAIVGMSMGVPMLGKMTKRCKITIESPNCFRVVLVQGLNRQIRRMCEYFEYQVLKLERVRIMNISLKGLPLGDWRDLTNTEMDTIYELIRQSSSEVHKKQKEKTLAGNKSISNRVKPKSDKKLSRSDKPNKSSAKHNNKKHKTDEKRKHTVGKHGNKTVKKSGGRRGR